MSTFRREVWIDYAKAIGIILVIISHTSGQIKSIDFGFLHAIHLVLFFLISGYTTKKKELTTSLINQRFRRLMIPYFVTCFAVTVTDIINRIVFAHDFSLSGMTDVIYTDILRSFFASGTNTSFSNIEVGSKIGAIWFLPALFFASILFQFLLNKTDDDKKLGVVTFCLMVVGHISGRFIWLPFSIQSALYAIFFLWIGYFIKKNGILNHVHWIHCAFAGLILILGIVFNYDYNYFVTANSKDLVLSAIVGLSGCLLIYFLSKSIKNAPLLQKIGINSLYVLCVHLWMLETCGTFLNKLLNHFNLAGEIRAWILMLLHIVIALVLGLLVNLLLKHMPDNKESATPETTRDGAVDIVKGICILLMLLGHLPISKGLRQIIFSVHMPAFIFLSGYFYKKRSIVQELKVLFKTLIIPYLLFSIAAVLVHAESLADIPAELIRYLAGMSFSKDIFVSYPSVGPVWFILMLVLTRIIFTVSDRITKSNEQTAWVVLGLSLLGFYLGRKGWWLPWSADVALYSLSFYFLGVLFKKHRILSLVKNNAVLYFILSIIWAYMIYSGGLELAIRSYPSYTITILGSISGIMIIYQFSSFLKNCSGLKAPAAVLSYIGSKTMIILFVHTLSGKLVNSMIPEQLSRNGAVYSVLFILAQVAIALLIDLIIGSIRKLYVTKKVD